MHISQSALTLAMQKVEDYLGVPIFERTKNRLSLNDTGKELIKNARLVLEAERTMKERTIAYYELASSISIGTIAPGPMIKYGQLLFSIFPSKNIASKIDDEENLLEGLKNWKYDFIFVQNPYEDEQVESVFAFTEYLYMTIPKQHFLAGLKDGVHFSEMDGQSFLVAENLGIWDKIIEKYLPKSRFLPQTMENLNEIVNASTIPTFSTNVTYMQKTQNGRISIPILDESAKVNFYMAYNKRNKPKIKEFLTKLQTQP